ncbi:MAG: hypothetical protein IJW59_00450 [Clostridia bacterium]|nr:hypothetical protein [Clostridia bacterium]
MEAEEKMILRDLPVDTRNYTIVDNITGKPIDQSTYTMTIDPEVIGKLNKLKQLNEEKIKQSALKAQYSDTSLVSTFTPTDNAVFTPVYNDEYINYHDYNTTFDNTPKVEEEVVEEVAEEVPEEHKSTEVIKSDSLLDRVVARDPSERPQEVEEVVEEPKEELDYISNYNSDGEYSNTQDQPADEIPADNSLFTPEMASLQQASEQIVNIDTDKLGQDIKSSKAFKKKEEKISLDKMEVISGKKIAWTAYILFFIPLLFKGKNRFVRLHANEGLELNIMEILSGILIAQYFLLPKLMETMSSTVSSISLIACIVGAGLLAGCLLTILPMMILSLCGVQAQTFWLWKRRMIKVSSERTAD